MIENCQRFFNNYINIQKGRKILKRFQKTNKKLQMNMETLRNKGKHSYLDYNEELEQVIALKNQEIHDIKMGCAEEFKRIRNLCFCNDYNGQFNDSEKIKKIYEIAEDNFSALLTDLAIEEEIGTETKIIELPQRQSRKFY